MCVCVYVCRPYLSFQLNSPTPASPPLTPVIPRGTSQATCNGNSLNFQCWINRQSKHRDGRSTTSDPEALYCHDSQVCSKWLSIATIPNPTDSTQSTTTMQTHQRRVMATC